VWNLLANAVKFTPAGGSIDVRLAPKEPHLEIVVSDTGRGISGDLGSFLIIVAVVSFSLMLDIVQEHRAEQTADALRTGLSVGEPYLLALGPGVEKTLVYLTVPPGLMATARTLPAMADVVIVARVRNGRSEPAGVPILDLQSITRQ